LAEGSDTGIESVEKDGILCLTINGPKTRNSIGPAAYGALHAEIDRAGGDPSIRAVVLTGANGFFSSGGNINALKESAQGTLAEATARTDRLNALILAVAGCPKPVIAAIEGGAAGVAVGLALACDLIVAGATAKFTVANIRVGLSPDGGTTYFLRSALPRQLVMEMCLLGAPMPAARLHAAGLVNVLAEDGGALDAAMALAATIAAGPPRALAATKALVNTAPDHGLAEHLEAEAGAINPARFGAEAAEGLAAFIARRPADFGAPAGREPISSKGRD
tara:strand:+ start:71692 stop:72525 length:834 start_codon:yes stop_codon:yes gene_type:complete